MKHLLLLLILLGALLVIFNDQTNLPAVIDTTKVNAINTYYSTHPGTTKNPLKIFTTDGCTLFPDSFFNVISWKDICIDHDIAYWSGGSRIEKDAADEKLKVDGNKIFPHLGDLMYFVVGVAGSPDLPTPWRWGYGKNFGSEYSN